MNTSTAEPAKEHATAQPPANTGTATAPSASPWKIRDYRVWFTADTSLLIGTTIGAFAFNLLGYTVSHDVAIAGIIATIYSLARGAATLIGGWMIDRVDRKRLMTASGLVSFAVLAILVGTWMTGLMSVPALFAISAARGLTSGLFAGVTDAVLPQIVSGQQLVDASAANQMRDTIANMLSSPLSGWLYAFGPEVPFIVSAVMYLILAVTAPFIKADLNPAPESTATNHEPDSSATATGTANSNTSSPNTSGNDNAPSTAAPSPRRDTSLMAGIRWYLRWPAALVNSALILLINFAFSLGSSILILHQQSIGTASWIIGMISLFNGVGSLIGSVFIAPLTKRFRGGRVIQLGLLPAVAGFAGMILTDNPWAVAALVACSVLLLLPVNAVCGSYFTLIMPNDMRGRLNSIYTLCATVFSSFASAVSGLLLKYLGYRPSMVIAVAFIAGAVALAFCAKSIRTIPFRSEFDTVKPLR